MKTQLIFSIIIIALCLALADSKVLQRKVTLG